MSSFSFLVAILTALPLSLLANFIVFRRQSLIGDAFSHIALPGIALAIFLKIDVILGALIFLILGSLLISFLEKKTSFYLEALTGFIFLISLALGKIFIKEEELIESLFGNLASTNFFDLLLAFIFCSLIIALIFRYRQELVLLTFSEELALAQGINKTKINLIFLLMISLAIALGIKISGALLVGSFLVIPPLAANLLAKNFNQLLIISSVFGIISAILGILLSFNHDPGPIIVIVQGILFTLIFIFKNTLKKYSIIKF